LQRFERSASKDRNGELDVVGGFTVIDGGVPKSATEVSGLVTIGELSPTDPFRNLLGIVGAARSRGLLTRVEIASDAFDEVLRDSAFAAALTQLSGERPLTGDPVLSMLELVLRAPVTILA
jgi:hypothetical protein